jgi:carbon monoxide dehydrogenase subunit G
MEFSGTETVAVPIERVWAYLADVNKVVACAPGFRNIEVLEPERWKALVAAGVGPIKATFVMDVTRPVLQKPHLMVVKVRGKAPGNAMELEGRMNLTAIDEEQTSMDWVARVAVSGMLAKVGAGLMNTLAETLTRQFFTCLKAHLQGAEAS